MKFTGFMPAGVELHGGFDQFHVERYSSWEYGDGSVDKIACFVSMRILAWTPLTFVKKNWVWTHLPVTLGLWKGRNSKITEAVDH